MTPGAVHPVRTIGSERRERDVHEVGLECTQVLVSESQLGQCPFAHVRDHDIDCRDQALEERATVLVVDLEAEAALLRRREVQRRKRVLTDRRVEAARQPARSPEPQRVGPSQRLHPDDVGAELGQVARRDRCRDAVAELEDADAGEREHAGRTLTPDT